jgi:DNA-directed RNA polymerase subunit alpha
LICDQGGDEERSIDYYERCALSEKAPVNAVVNLAALYEEHGQLRRAESCLIRVLDEFPEHTRALQFLKSVQSSFLMIYDERGQREREQRDAVMDMPISEFELSVRSRNCLRQMNIRSLGDLVRTSEAQLLGYKNFGETSLNEIRALLTQKGLRLGQGQAAPAAAAAAATTPAPEPAAPAPAEVNGNLHMLRPVSELELSVRSRKCLQRLGITTIGELIQCSARDLMTTKNFGQTSLSEIERQLAQMGLGLKKSHEFR